MLRVVLSPTPTDEMVSKPSPSPLASFSEGFFPLFLSLGYLWHDVSIGEFNDLMVTSVDSLDNALLHEVCVNNVGRLGCDILHAVDS
jgi:hypothetical protein